MLYDNFDYLPPSISAASLEDDLRVLHHAPSYRPLYHRYNSNLYLATSLDLNKGPSHIERRIREILMIHHYPNMADQNPSTTFLHLALSVPPGTDAHFV